MYIDEKDKYFQVGRSLLASKKVQLLLFLDCNIDVFAWSPYEAPRVDSKFICNRLNVDRNCITKKEKSRRSSDIHFEVVKENVEKLKEARAIEEVFFT